MTFMPNFFSLFTKNTPQIKDGESIPPLPTVGRHQKGRQKPHLFRCNRHTGNGIDEFRPLPVAVVAKLSKGGKIKAI
jgi:hypothetical protein